LGTVAQFKVVSNVSSSVISADVPDVRVVQEEVRWEELFSDVVRDGQGCSERAVQGGFKFRSSLQGWCPHLHGVSDAGLDTRVDKAEFDVGI
jgi:hypothetical protein